MGVDPSVVGKKSEPNYWEYDWKDVVLYALGIGAKEDELEFVYENTPGGVKVFPSFAVIAAFGMTMPFGTDIDFTQILHGEQSIRLFRPFPSQGKIERIGEVTSIYDKQKAAVINTMITGNLEGEKIFEAEMGIFYRGGGGFGGDPGPKAEKIVPPEGAKPNFSVAYEIPKSQAALYRLSGDYNPLHIDPEFAALGGFDRPILHGLCTYGHATRAMVYELCDGDVSRFKEFKARFTDVVFPGETLTTEGWKDGERYIVQCRTDRAVVMGNANAIVD
jgi:acyl dehydratase